MANELTYLTFLEDPATYQARPGDLCIQVPAGISSAQDLVNVLQEQLGFPPITTTYWYTLREYLGFWQEERSDLPPRVVIIHHDLPLWQAHRLWWLDVQGYVYALADTIAHFRERQANGEPVQGPELVAIFPQAVYEELQAVLTRPPDWQMSLEFAGYSDYPITTEIDPSWSLIQEYVRHLEGPMAEVCSLSREGVGSIVAQYLRHLNAYCLQYTEPAGSIIPFFASEQEQPASWPPTLSLTQVEQSFHQFFTQEKLSETLHWIREPAEMFGDMALLKLAHFRGPEEALLEHSVPHEGPARAVVARGVREALQEKQAAFGLTYWQQLLKQPTAPLSLRLAAICIVGRSDLPNAADLLRPLLKSPVKQERWVSARFCGLWKDEEALPVLVSMLTDEQPFERPEASTLEELYEKELQYEWGWYDIWRGYVPYLLRPWQTQEVGERMREALAIWVREEPSFKYEEPTYPEEVEDAEELDKLSLVSGGFAAQLCFELGYRGDTGVLEDLPIGKRYRFELQQAINKGTEVRRRCKTPLEEYQYRARERKLPAFLGW